MLILSRGVGESVVFDNEVVATVAVLGREFVDLGLSKISGEPLGTVTLTSDGLSPIAKGVQGIVVKLLADKVRLGFDFPRGMTITRSEIPPRPDRLS